MSTLARLLLLYCLGALANASAATFVWRFNDNAGVGFNDPTPIPADQRGNNPGLTFGEARRNLLMEAGRVWGALLVSNVPIVVDAVFSPQMCDAMTGTLASAGAQTYFRDFSNSPGISRDTFFASALADSIAGKDLMKDPSIPMGQQNDPAITATFNLSVDTDPNCLNGIGFYYGFDHNKGRRIDTLVVALHELAHGFGFASEIDPTTGTGFKSDDGVARFSSYVFQIFDENLNSTWPMLTPDQRITSAKGNIGLTWNGTAVNAQLATFTGGVSGNGRLRLFSPDPVSNGSSVSHWDRSATPNILMEPNISTSIVTSSVDVTVCALRDIGWQTTRCPDANVVMTGRAPTSSPQSVTVAEDAPMSIMLTATDPDGDMLTYSIVQQPSKGTLSSGNSAARLYTPNANATGTDSFMFAANDGNGNSSAPSTVSINITPVNDPPVAGAVTVQVTSGQATSLSLIGSDVDGDAVTYEVVTMPSKGTLSGTGAVMTYQSVSGSTGTDSFTYRVRDATTVSNTATVNITVVSATAPIPGGRGGGGGGAMNELLLAALALLAMARLYKSRATARAQRR